MPRKKLGKVLATAIQGAKKLEDISLEPENGVKDKNKDD